MKPKIKKCADTECNNEFRPFNTLQKYCSAKCLNKNKKPNLGLKKIYKPPKKVSDKRKIDNLKYQSQRIVFLGKPENKICPITGKQTTDIHHMKGRIGNLLLDQKYWLAVSREGHQKIEENPEWAKQMGYSLNRLDKQ